MNRKIHIIAISVFSAVFFAITAANILQPTRATYSEAEKRELATFPKFTLQALAKGEFFAGIDNFVSDTFIFRNEFIEASRKINSLWSLNTYIGNDDDIIFIPTTPPIVEVDIDSPLLNIDKEKPTEEPEEVEPDTPTVEDPTTEEPKVEEPITEEPKTDEPLTDEPTSEEPKEEEPPVVPEKQPEIQEPAENLTEIEAPHGVGEPEFLSSGHIIYGDAVLSIPYLVKSVAQYYADVVGYYAYLFPDSRVSTVCAPLSSSMVTDPRLKNKITDQKKMIDTINSYLEEGINGVNCFDNLFAHRDEYLYYKSDHHWTARGGYYAYEAFARSVGLTPTPLEDFEEVLMNESWNGSMAYLTGDERIKELRDEVYAYIPTKKHTMTTYSAKGEVSKFKTSILTAYRSYDGFMNGDNAYTVISVPDNPQDMTALVFIDSYGRAFVPYLIEHYGTIITVDPRYIYFNVYEHLKDYKITDIIFANNLYNPNVLSYPKNLMRAVGQ